jgi:hypothetical protein
MSIAPCPASFLRQKPSGGEHKEIESFKSVSIKLPPAG